MTTFHRIAAGVLLSASLFTGVATGQVSSRKGEPMPVDQATAQRLFGTMKRDLRNLATAQEVYFADHSTYGSRLGVSGDTSRVQIDPSPGVTVTLTYSTRSVWAARAVHDWLPGRSCVILMGAVPTSRTLRTATDKKIPTKEGEVVCDAW